VFFSFLLGWGVFVSCLFFFVLVFFGLLVWPRLRFNNTGSYFVLVVFCSLTPLLLSRILLIYLDDELLHRSFFVVLFFLFYRICGICCWVLHLAYPLMRIP